MIFGAIYRLFAFADMFRSWRFGVSSPHQTPIRIKAQLEWSEPLPLFSDQKIFGARPCPSFFGADLMVIN